MFSLLSETKNKKKDYDFLKKSNSIRKENFEDQFSRKKNQNAEREKRVNQQLNKFIPGRNKSKEGE